MWQKIKSFLFKNTSTRQTVAKNTFWLTISNVGGRLLRALIIIYAARVLGAAEWGVFAYATSLIAFLTSFIDLGINSILTRETAKGSNPVREEQILSTSFFLKIILLVLAILIVLFVAPYLTKNAAVKMLL